MRLMVIVSAQYSVVAWRGGTFETLVMMFEGAMFIYGSLVS